MEDRLKELRELSLNLDDSNERKLLRQERLKRRHEHAATLQLANESEGTMTQKEKTHLEKTIDNSNENLFQIYVGGKDLVTNIRVTADSREIQRRNEEVATRNLRLDKLEEDASKALEKMKAISDKWDDIYHINAPLDLCQELKDQKARCYDLMAQKDELVMNLKEELKLKDERYVNDRNDMWEDLGNLARRINEQVLVMKESYMIELRHIEDAISKTRDEDNMAQCAEWSRLFENRENEEVKHLAKYLDTIENDEAEIQRLHIMHDEQYRNVKIRLDTDVQVLEQELERIKATCLVNSEKLDYNYQVLKKREDENVFIKNNQKRMLNKLQDEVTKLRKKKEEKDTDMKAKLRNINKEICRLHKNIVDIENKSDHFSQVNNKQLVDMWQMKTKDADVLLKKIQNADKIIHEKILGLEWQPPENMPLKMEQLPSYTSALVMVAEVFKPAEPALSKNNSQDETNPIEMGNGLRSILALIADNAGFLIEERLEELIQPYTQDEQTLVRLDNVFNAIGVQSKDEVNMLHTYFMPYATCQVCPGVRNVTETLESGRKEESVNQIRSVCAQNHPLQVQRQDVLKVLKDFVFKIYSSNIRKKNETVLRVAKDRCTISRLISNDDIIKYWMSYQEYFPKTRQNTWDELHSGLTKYHKILQERDKYARKAQRLREENQELMTLVDKYVHQAPSN